MSMPKLSTIRVAAPGCVDLIGEHTDYNEGFAFPMAIPMVTVIAAKQRDDKCDTCCVHTLND